MADTLTGGPAPQTPISRSPEVSRWLYDNTPIPETTRFRQMDRFEAHYKTTQYDHLEYDWWGASADQTETISPSVMVPKGYEQPAMAMSVRNKRPTAPYHLCKAIVDRFTGLLLSEGRKPEIVVENDTDSEDFLKAAMHQARFWPTWRLARSIGGAVGTVCVTAHLRDGKYAMEVHNGKFLTVLWKDRRSFIPQGVLKQYKIIREEPRENPETGEVEAKPQVYLIRRIITEHEDIVFKPALLRDGDVPQMEVADHVNHNLGFFPGVWVQNMPVLDDDDGDPDCEGAWQTFDTIDRLLSQMNKGVLLNMDPTLKLKVDPRVIELGGGVRKGSDNSLNVGVDGDAGYLEINGAGITVGQALVERLKQNALDMTSCILVDPEVISGAAQSAKAIEYLYAPMLEKADVLRSQYGDLGIVPMCEIFVKLARWAEEQVQATDAGPAKVRLDLPPKTTRFVPSPSAHAGARVVTHSVPHKLGFGGHIKLTWGPYFSQTEQDKQLAVNTLVAAREGALIDDETAVHAAALIFKVKDSNQMFKKVKEQSDADAENAMGDPDQAAVLPPNTDPAQQQPGVPPKPGAKAPGAAALNFTPPNAAGPTKPADMAKPPKKPPPQGV
jgi:hypothetical protein